ncbi:MAG TPA: DUF4432 family protein [bacterium]|nr:DUF4432 family protein [bacterium]HOM27057.1 DUF4432 family protein [bacterium]
MLNRNNGCRFMEFEWKGYKCIYLENEIIRVEILVDKGTDIVEFLYKEKDIDFMWRSPIPVYHQSKLIQTAPTKLGSFIDYYPGGWQEIFPNGGGICEYKGAILGLHGEVALLPWDYKIIEDTKDRVSIKFSVYTYRTPFYLEKIITIKSGIPYIEIYEEVFNLAGEEVDFIWGHHPAFGKPFLSENCIINIKGGKVKVVPGDGKSYTNLKQTEGNWPFVEGIDGKQVDISKVPSEEDNVSDVIFISDLEEGYYEIINESLKTGFFMEFPKEVFKYLWFWRIAKGSYNYPWWGRNYNIALEPFSSLPNLAEAIKRNDQLKLKENCSLKVSLKAGVKKI